MARQAGTVSAAWASGEGFPNLLARKQLRWCSVPAVRESGRLARRGVRGAAATTLLIAALLAGAVPAQAVTSASIAVLSHRADLISGGDALVAVNLPAGTD